MYYETCDKCRPYEPLGSGKDLAVLAVTSDVVTLSTNGVSRPTFAHFKKVNKSFLRDKRDMKYTNIHT